ncbi:Transcriptional regulatory protein NatR [termite gut metagenome]|uniref:Transcriptional regulatory protein NatR n=1 Tax=termite gut metagenome TaxID=433724 RepID=A0A5J4SXL8_9ZZZZ
MHPLLESMFSRITTIAIAAFATFLLWMLLVLYGNTYSYWALAESVTYVGILLFAGFLYWYVRNFLQLFYIRLVIAILVQMVALAIISGYLLLFGSELLQNFVTNIPLYLIFGSLCWLSFTLWYHNLWQLEFSEEKEEAIASFTESHEIIDRISIKEGTRIHIIQREELFYIRACGDYVVLVTAKGEFIKEQTMKYFETHLPDTFVRIHRSYIINTNHTTRIELFSKEKYSVWLKSGEKLRASSTGYKLLKERLRL